MTATRSNGNMGMRRNVGDKLVSGDVVQVRAQCTDCGGRQTTEIDLTGPANQLQGESCEHCGRLGKMVRCAS